MDTAEEKRYIYDMMRTITEERRDLSKMYYELKVRLDEIILLEIKGLDKTSIVGIVDLHNSKEAQQIRTNIEREAMGIIRKVEEETESKIVATTPTEDELISKDEVILLSQDDAAQKKITENLENEESTEEEPKQIRVYSRSGTNSIDKLAGIIAHILKEHGTPIKSKDLYELVNAQLVDSPIKRANFSNNVLPRASRLNPKINNVSHGYWQYLHS